MIPAVKIRLKADHFARYFPHRTFFRLASSILEKCESCEGAAARSMYQLAMALRRLGEVDEAAKYDEQIVELLEHVLDPVDTQLFGLDYFEQFVLYCHR